MKTQNIDNGNLAAQAAALCVFGGAEATTALISVSLDQQQNMNREAERRAEKAAQAAAEEQLENMRDAAMFKLGASLTSAAADGVGVGLSVNGLATGASATTDAAKAAAKETAQVWTKAARATGDVHAAVFSACEADAQHGAKAAEIQHDAQKSAMQSERDAGAAIRQMNDKALAHLDQISRARAEAMMAATRG